MKTALVLAGGGSRGAYQIGVWQALKELDIQIDIITGTSVGALNGALITQNSFEKALALWENLNTKMVFDLKDEPSLSAYAKEFFKKGGATAGGLLSLTEQYLDEEAIRTSPIEFGLVTVKKKGLTPCELYMEDIPKGQLNDYLMASAACYPAVKSHQIEDTQYIDGGYYDNMPIQLAIKKGAEKIIAVNLESVGLLKTPVKELKNAKNVIYISPGWDLGNFLIFQEETAKRNIRLGYLDTLKAFGFFDGKAYTFAKHDFSRMAKQKQITLREWKSFFQTARTKGTILQSTGYLAMEKALEAETHQPLTTPVILEICAETAGKIFDLSPLTLYNTETFHQTLAKAANQAFKEKKISSFVRDFHDKKLSLKAEWLKKLDSKTVTLFLEALCRENPEFVFPVAHLFPKEALAGFYLWVFGLLS